MTWGFVGGFISETVQYNTIHDTIVMKGDSQLLD